MTYQQNLKRDILKSLLEFAEIQAVHKDALTKEKLGGIMTWRAQRSMAWGRLKNHLHLAEASGLIPNDEAFSLRVAKGIKDLLAAEDDLRNSVVRGRKELDARLNSIRQGKKVLTGYSPYHGKKRGPKFFSSRT